MEDGHIQVTKAIPKIKGELARATDTVTRSTGIPLVFNGTSPCSSPGFVATESEGGRRGR